MTELEDKIRTVIEGEKSKLPSFVEDIRFALDADSSGDLSVRIFIIVKDDSAQSTSVIKESLRLRESIIQSLRNIGVSLSAYFRFLGKGEQSELANA